MKDSIIFSYPIRNFEIWIDTISLIGLFLILIDGKY